MSERTKYIIAGIAGLTVVLGAAGAIAHRMNDHGGFGRPHGRHGNASMGMMGMAGFGFGGPMHRFCRGDGTEMADHLFVRIEHRLKPTDAQKPAFEEFKTATLTAAKRMQEGCPKRPADEGSADAKPTPIERLAEAQTGLEASLDALKTFRPAAEKFYATLDDTQKAKLNERRGWRHDRRFNKNNGTNDDKPAAPEEPGPDNRG